MMKIDHLTISVGENYHADQETMDGIRAQGFPYEPKWGRRNKQYQTSNLWIGDQYLELCRPLTPEAKGWNPQWAQRCRQGHRGLLCLMLEVDDIDAIYERITLRGLPITKPEYLKLRWGPFSASMPWRNSFFPFLQGEPFQIGLQQMKSQRAADRLRRDMKPNSRDNGIMGLREITVRGSFTQMDFQLLAALFRDGEQSWTQYTAPLSGGGQATFQRSEESAVEVTAVTSLSLCVGKQFQVENVRVTVKRPGEL